MHGAGKGIAAPCCILQDNTGRLLKHMASAADDLDALFIELDLNLTNSRNIFSQVPASASTPSEASFDSCALDSNALDIRQTAPQQQQQQSAIEAADLDVPAYVHIGDPLLSEQSCIQQADAAKSTVDW